MIIVKPMRDYSAKEIAFYNRMFAVPSVFLPSLETKVSSRHRTDQALGRAGGPAPAYVLVHGPVFVRQTPEKASIQRLTESFVTKLQADFPSTVSTVYRSELGPDASRRG